MEREKNKRREYWVVRVNEYRESGESLRGWCEMVGIKRSSMRYWLERLEELACDDGNVRFARVLLRDEVGEQNDI